MLMPMFLLAGSVPLQFFPHSLAEEARRQICEQRKKELEVWYGFGAKMETLHFHNEKHSIVVLFVSRVK